MDLTGWTYLLTFGYDLDVYAYNSARVGIDRKTGRTVISYTIEG